MQNPWTTLTKQIIYQNPWIEISHREVINPSGGEGIYGVVHFKNIAVGVIPIDDEGNVYLVGQHRYPLARYSWEIPEGGCPLETDPLETAKRELLEETGIIASNWKLIQELDVSNSVTDEIGMLYVAQGLTFGKSKPEATEDISVKKVSLLTAIQMCENGEIRDSFTLIGLYKIALSFQNNSFYTEQFRER